MNDEPPDDFGIIEPTSEDYCRELSRPFEELASTNLSDISRRETADCGRGEERAVGGINRDSACTTNPESITRHPSVGLAPAQESNSSANGVQPDAQTVSAQSRQRESASKPPLETEGCSRSDKAGALPLSRQKSEAGSVSDAPESDNASRVSSPNVSKTPVPSLTELLDEIERKTPEPWTEQNVTALVECLGAAGLAKQINKEIAAARSDVPALVKVVNRALDYIRADLPKVRADVIEADLAPLLREPVE